MKLYYASGTGSLASRIILHEVGLEARCESVDLLTRATETGADFRTINPKGYVPALVLENGEFLTENVAVLYWNARQAPDTAPTGPFGDCSRRPPSSRPRCTSLSGRSSSRQLESTSGRVPPPRSRAASTSSHRHSTVPTSSAPASPPPTSTSSSCSGGRAASASPFRRRSPPSAGGLRSGPMCGPPLPRRPTRNRPRSGGPAEPTGWRCPMLLSRRLNSIVVRLAAWRQNGPDPLYAAATASTTTGDWSASRSPFAPVTARPCAISVPSSTGGDHDRSPETLGTPYGPSPGPARYSAPAPAQKDVGTDRNRGSARGGSSRRSNGPAQGPSGRAGGTCGRPGSGGPRRRAGAPTGYRSRSRRSASGSSTPGRSRPADRAVVGHQQPPDVGKVDEAVIPPQQMVAWDMILDGEAVEERPLRHLLRSHYSPDPPAPPRIE